MRDKPCSKSVQAPMTDRLILLPAGNLLADILIERRSVKSAMRKLHGHDAPMTGGTMNCEGRIASAVTMIMVGMFSHTGRIGSDWIVRLPVFPFLRGRFSGMLWWF
jgi:hypothetical protein